MKRLLSIFTIYLTLTAFPLLGQENKIEISVSSKFASRDLSKIQTLQDIARNIAELTTDKKEQLQMLLLWSHHNMFADSIRFFQDGYPLSTAESLKKRIALCDEFSNILTEFCKIMKIPSLRIDGYVRHLNFKPGDKFAECNHAWNAVYIDSTWLLCDILWATNVLVTNISGSTRFVRRLNIKYFLAAPKTFIADHLPCDPVFQFDNYPIKINAFTALSDSIDLKMERLPYLNHNDSLQVLMKLGDNDRTLRIAKHAYQYNKNNPNFLITEYYNYGVSIVNNKTSTKAELKKAKNYFSSAITLTNQSLNQEIRALKDSCEQGLTIISRRLNVR